MPRSIDHFIGGKRVPGTSGRTAPVFDPNTGEIQAHVALASGAETQEAIANAAAAQPGWAATNPQRRARVLARYVELINRDMAALARTLSSEHGKTMADARGDVQRGLEVDRVRHRHPAFAQGRVHGVRRHRASTSIPCASLWAWLRASRRSISRP